MIFIEDIPMRKIMYQTVNTLLIQPGRFYEGEIKNKKVRFYVVGFASLDGKKILIRIKGVLQKISTKDIQNVKLSKAF